MIGSWNSHEFDILNSILREGDQRKINQVATKEIDFHGSSNTIHKIPLNQGEIYGVPHFSAKNLKHFRNERDN